MIVTKYCTLNYVTDVYPHAKFCPDQYVGIFSYASSYAALVRQLKAIFSFLWSHVVAYSQGVCVDFDAQYVTRRRIYEMLCLFVVVVSGMQLEDCVAPYVDIILHRGRFWAKSAASGSVRWYCFRSCCTVLSHVMLGRPGRLLQSAGGEDNRILLASALSSMRIICPNRVSRRDWIIARSLGCFVSLRTSSFRTNCQAAYADTTGQVHRSYVRPS